MINKSEPLGVNAAFLWKIDCPSVKRFPFKGKAVDNFRNVFFSFFSSSIKVSYILSAIYLLDFSISLLYQQFGYVFKSDPFAVFAKSMKGNSGETDWKRLF